MPSLFQKGLLCNTFPFKGGARHCWFPGCHVACHGMALYSQGQEGACNVNLNLELCLGPSSVSTAPSPVAVSMKTVTEFRLQSTHLPSTECVSFVEWVPLLLKTCLSLVCQLQLEFSPCGNSVWGDPAYKRQFGGRNFPQGPPQWELQLPALSQRAVPSSIFPGL